MNFHTLINTAKSVAQRASRALGLLSVKSKHIGDMPYMVFIKLYESRQLFDTDPQCRA